MRGTVTVTWDYPRLLTLFNRIKQTQNRQAEWECRFSPGHGQNEEYIPGSRQNPKILWVYDTEVVGDGIAELQPVFWDFLA